MFDAKKTADDLTAWIRDYFAPLGEGSNAVIGISGGKDSSVAAALCAKALGPNRVLGILMPCGYQHDLEYALELAAAVKIRHFVHNIGEAVQNTLQTLEQNLGRPPAKDTVTNLPARIRMSTLMAYAQSENARLICTSNLSEDWVGYSTLFGDCAGHIAPLSKLTSEEVVEVGRTLSVPERLLSKIPEDGLTGKTDEENLGFTYSVLNKYIREGICEDPTVKEKIDSLHCKNKFKLEFLPLMPESNLPVRADD